MRLSADLIQNSLSYINTLTERELDLRGHKIPAIENLGVAKDQDCIDFTDNDISLLGNFPFSPRLRTLLLARNRISHIQPTITKTIPNLSTLVLAHNQIAELSDLEPLSGLLHLTSLTVAGNPVVQKEHYRAYIVHLIPSLRFLDHTRITLHDRESSASLLGTLKTPTALAQQISSIKSKTFANASSTNGDTSMGGVGGEKKMVLRLTDKEKKKVEQLIREAKSLSEIARLEKALGEGRLPPGVIVD